MYEMLFCLEIPTQHVHQHDGHLRFRHAILSFISGLRKNIILLTTVTAKLTFFKHISDVHNPHYFQKVHKEVA